MHRNDNDKLRLVNKFELLQEESKRNQQHEATKEEKLKLEQAEKLAKAKKKVLLEEEERVRALNNEARVAQIKKQFEGKVHPYGAVGGNKVDAAAYNQPVVGDLKPSKQPVKPTVSTPVTSETTVAPKPVSSPKKQKAEPVKVQEKPKAAPVKPQVKSQEELDLEYARKLQEEFAREQQAEDYALALRLQKEEDENLDDHILAARLQIEEEVKTPLQEFTLPEKEEIKKQKEDLGKFELTNLGQAAQDVYNRGLANLPKPQPKPQANDETQNAKDYLGNFALNIFIQTRSIELALVGNQFIYREVSHFMAISIIGNQDFLDISINAISSFTSIAGYNQHGLFGEAKAANQLLANKAANKGPTIEEIKDKTKSKPSTQQAAPQVFDIDDEVNSAPRMTRK